MNKLCAKDGRVHKDEFVSWYIEWVFADNDDDEDYEPLDNCSLLDES